MFTFTVAPASRGPNRPARRPLWVPVTLIVLSVLISGVAAWLTYGLLAEYGTTTGSLIRGAWDGLGFAALPLAVSTAVAAAAFLAGRGRRPLRVAAVLVAVLGVAAVLGAGAQAAAAKYEWQPRLPDCGADEFGASISEMLHRVEAAFAELDHPRPFSGGGSAGYDGCHMALLDISFDAAAAHYRPLLPQAGWRITHDDDRQLRAKRGDLVLVLSERGPDSYVGFTIRPTREASAELLKNLN